MTETVRQLTPTEAIALIRGDCHQHFELFTKIKMKDGQTRQPEANKLQEELFVAVMYLDGLLQPINVIVLKPRQSGGSEGTAEVVYHHMRRYNLSGLMMADQHKRTDKIWELFCAKLGNDAFNDHWGNTLEFNQEKATLKWKGEDGRVQKALFERDTALDPKAGASGTRQIVWLSEAARYAKEGTFKDTEVIGNVLSSIPPNQPHTMRIMESTAEGAGGAFYEIFKNAVYFDDRVNGKIGNGWLKIFVGAHECIDYVLTPGPMTKEYFDDEEPRWAIYAEDEEAYRIRYKLTPGQIAWRRWKIESEFGGDVNLFKRDFPYSPEEAWASSGSKRFHVVAVARLLKAAEALWEKTLRGDATAPKLGSLVDGAGGVVFLPQREDAWLWVKEAPEYGRSYSIVIDPMTGEQSAGSDKRDNHAVGVIRAEYVDEKGVLYPAEMVAAIYLPAGCQWDIDVLAARVIVLWKWYGKCIVIPEVNKAMDLIPPLKAANVTLYLRPARADAENPSERQKVIGFYTSEATRRMWVSAAAEGIRESTLVCLFLPAVKEMDAFIVLPNGRAEAAPGSHDDWVAMYGIGKLTIGACTRMALPIVRSSPRNYSGGRSTVQSKGSGAFG